jgi:adenylyl-sulfate kinase
MKKALVFWFTGLSGSGKTTIANGVKPLLEEQGYSVLILDGDEVRNKLHRNLGFSEEDIKENNLLIAKMCKTNRLQYDIIMVPIISPYASPRNQARDLLGSGFYEIYFDANLDWVMARDVKGLYTKAKLKQINNLIGYSPANPYQIPQNPDFIVHSGRDTIENCVKGFYDFIISCLNKHSRRKKSLVDR